MNLNIHAQSGGARPQAGEGVRLDSLTALRFAAAMLVVLYHTGRYILPEAVPFTGLGYFGVSFFFVLSGFVLAWSMKAGTGVRAFYWKRFARIYPLHLVMTAVAAIYLALSFGAIPWTKLPPVLLLMQSWIPSGEWKYAFNGVSWSLACEAFFYLIFPFIAPRLTTTTARKGRALAVAIFGAAMMFAALMMVTLPEEYWGALTYTNPAFRVVEFILGILLASAFKRGWRPRFGLRFGLAAVACCYLLAYFVDRIFWNSLLDMPFVIANLLTLPGTLLLIAGAVSSDLGGQKSNPVLVRLGEWSFALYLVHEIFLRAGAQLSLKGPSSFVLAFVILVLSIGASAALYAWVERPLEKMLRTLIGASPRPEEERAVDADSPALHRCTRRRQNAVWMRK
ncbi:acyltransferase family protein [Sinomonas flava]|uniref:acyltransferase family protein n=1 Tax=Sinomonas flava TaxID=496857 RepID=UPI0039A4193D